MSVRSGGDAPERVELVRVPAEDRSVLRNLVGLYLYDLSEYTGPDVNEHGLYEYPRLDQYWLDESCHPLLIRVDGRIAGFVLVHQHDLLQERRHVVAEFFVMRKYRRRGVGTRAARLVFDAFPGPWEVSELPENEPAQAFWRRVIAALTDGAYTETVVDGRPVQYFDYPTKTKQTERPGP
ncbi:MAG: GNAT family N-acetyltransferase [Firmicutes bacterium]|nr:GNAT family N-acetyltransferase [Bacillota bacterium]